MIYKNIFSGITVGIIALPLSMALAIAVGVPPQNGLYTAIIAGIIAGVFGSSKVNISGPTAAFVVILIPIVQEFGLSGLLICGLASGFILILIGLFKFGKLIELIPYPVTVGFTTGIAVVIAIFQIKDFFGLTIENFSGHFHQKVYILFNSFHTISLSETLIGFLTLFILISWSKTKSKIPPALIALSICTVLVYVLNSHYGFNISTIKSTFSYDINGIKGEGIPPVALQFTLPWENINFDLFNLDTVYKLLPHSVAIAILGALESLLCAVITDGMTKNNTNPNRELIGQGLANIAVPFFGGIPATAAIARSAANIRSGATGKLSSVVHAIFVLLAILLFAPYLSYLPMASLSALLLIVAWNMSEIKHFINIIRIAPRHDIYVLLTCFTLTVFLDMQIAIGVGMGLASILFIKRTIDLYSIDLLNDSYDLVDVHIPENVSIYSINGPMFFGAAQSALRTLISTNNDIDTLIIDMKNVPIVDMTGLVAFKSIIQNMLDNEKKLIVCGLNDRIKNKFKKAKIEFDNKNIYNCTDIKSAISSLSN